MTNPRDERGSESVEHGQRSVTSGEVDRLPAPRAALPQPPCQGDQQMSGFIMPMWISTVKMRRHIFWAACFGTFLVAA